MAIREARQAWILLSTTSTTEEVQESQASVQPTRESLTRVTLPGGLPALGL